MIPNFWFLIPDWVHQLKPQGIAALQLPHLLTQPTQHPKPSKPLNLLNPKP